MQALGLIARFYSLRPVAEHLATVGADDLYSVGQEILRSKQNLKDADGGRCRPHDLISPALRAAHTPCPRAPVAVGSIRRLVEIGLKAKK